jgi:hypothetical protein
MRPASIVVIGPLTKGSPQMSGVQRNEIVPAFATYASNQPFAMSIGEGGQLHGMVTLPILLLKSSILIIH